MLAILILYKRVMLILFGKKVTGYIVGYDNRTEGMKGVDTYNYRVKYEFGNKEYFASALESVQVPRNSIPNKNMHRQVVVCFNEKNPYLVTVYDFKETTMLAIGMMLSGGVFIFLSQMIND